jgi:hypothetical protein
MHGSAVEEDGAGIRSERAGEDADEGALAGAVLSEEGMHLAGAQFEASVLEGSDAREGLHDPVEAEERARVHFRNVGSCSASAFR